MFSRIITCTIQPDRVEEFRHVVNYECLSQIQEQRGFVENIESLDPASGKFCSVTLWKSEDDVREYERGLFQEIAEWLTPMMVGAPIIETLPVENASAHNIRAGRSASDDEAPEEGGVEAA